MNLLEQTYTDTNESRILVEQVLEDTRNSVVATMGPNSKVALIIDKNLPFITKDGVRVMSALEYNEHRRNAIATTINQACQRTEIQVGDGTTTTAFMVCELFKQFKDDNSFNDNKLILKLIEMTKESIFLNTTMVKPEDEGFTLMAATSANYQSDIVEKVVNIYKQYPRPFIELKENNTLSEDRIESTEKIEFTGRWPFTKLVPNGGRSTFNIEEGTNVLIIDDSIDIFKQETMDKLYDYGYNNMLTFIIARNFGHDCCTQFEYLNAKLNEDKGGQAFSLIPYTVEAIGNMGSAIISDLGALFGTNTYSSVNVLPEVIKPTQVPFTINNLGISLDSENAFIKNKANEIVKELEISLEQMTITQRVSVLGQMLNNRISQLNGQKVTIQVTGITGGEASERRHLFEDAIEACKSALKFGVIPGIGWGLANAAEDIYKYLQEEDSNLSDREKIIINKYINVLVAPYELLNGREYQFDRKNLYHNQITGEAYEVPNDVMDNGYASIIAIESAWSVVNRLSKLSCIMGKTSSGNRN